jgi:hypothetical protein
VRPRTVDERETLPRGLRAAEALPVRRGQRRLASAEGQPTTTRAHAWRCHAPMVRKTLHAFNPLGVAVRRRQSSRPHRPRAVFRAEGREQLRALLPQRPRPVGQPTRRWTLQFAAEVSYATGRTPRQVRGAAMRLVLRRLGGRWGRATCWIIRPAPASLRKQNDATACSSGPRRLRRGRAAVAMQSGGVAWRTPPSMVGWWVARVPAFRS